jgi:hypothetical protein
VKTSILRVREEDDDWWSERNAEQIDIEAQGYVKLPVPLVLHCPECRARHIDEGDNATRIHRTHACQACGLLWAPAVVPTVGVRFLPGCKDAVAIEELQRVTGFLEGSGG